MVNRSGGHGWGVVGGVADRRPPEKCQPPTILSAASNASNNGIDLCFGLGSATAALVARYTANGRCFASK